MQAGLKSAGHLILGQVLGVWGVPVMLAGVGAYGSLSIVGASTPSMWVGGWGDEGGMKGMGKDEQGCVRSGEDEGGGDWEGRAAVLF